MAAYNWKILTINCQMGRASRFPCDNHIMHYSTRSKYRPRIRKSLLWMCSTIMRLVGKAAYVSCQGNQLTYQPVNVWYGLPMLPVPHFNLGLGLYRPRTLRILPYVFLEQDGSNGKAIFTNCLNNIHDISNYVVICTWVCLSGHIGYSIRR